MSRQTFDGTGAAWQDGLDVPLSEQRLSILAICALVFAILCVIPGTGIVAAICGVSALFFISTSRGRISGKGLAISGIVLGLLMTSLWGGVLLGMRQAVNFFSTVVAGPAIDVIEGAQNSDYARARGGLSPDAIALVKDADFDKFRDAYSAELGAFQHPTRSMVQLVQGYASLGPQLKKFKGRDDFIPVPAVFEKGIGLVVFQMDRKALESGSSGSAGTSTGANERIPVKNIQIIAASGHSFVLIDAGTAATASGFGPDEGGFGGIHIGKKGSKKKVKVGTGTLPGVSVTVDPKSDDADEDEKPGEEKPGSDKPAPTPAPKAPQPPSKPDGGRG